MAAEQQQCTAVRPRSGNESPDAVARAARRVGSPTCAARNGIIVISGPAASMARHGRGCWIRDEDDMGRKRCGSTGRGKGGRWTRVRGDKLRSFRSRAAIYWRPKRPARARPSAGRPARPAPPRLSTPHSRWVHCRPVSSFQPPRRRGLRAMTALLSLSAAGPRPLGPRRDSARVMHHAPSARRQATPASLLRRRTKRRIASRSGASPGRVEGDAEGPTECEQAYLMDARALSRESM